MSTMLTTHWPQKLVERSKACSQASRPPSFFYLYCIGKLQAGKTGSTIYYSMKWFAEDKYLYSSWSHWHSGLIVRDSMSLNSWLLVSMWFSMSICKREAHHWLQADHMCNAELANQFISRGQPQRLEQWEILQVPVQGILLSLQALQVMIICDRPLEKCPHLESLIAVSVNFQGSHIPLHSFLLVFQSVICPATQN